MVCRKYLELTLACLFHFKINMLDIRISKSNFKSDTLIYETTSNWILFFLSTCTCLSPLLDLQQQRVSHC